MKRQRISLAKEDRIAELRRQGYDYSSIAAIVNAHKSSVRDAVQRHGRRWKFPGDPRKGRIRAFLSDEEIDQIRRLFDSGITQLEISRQFYGLAVSSISAICCGKTYAEPGDDGFDYSINFRNRWNRSHSDPSTPQPLPPNSPRPGPVPKSSASAAASAVSRPLKLSPC